MSDGPQQLEFGAEMFQRWSLKESLLATQKNSVYPVSRAVFLASIFKYETHSTWDIFALGTYLL